jgi:hypothetical protein
MEGLRVLTVVEGKLLNSREVGNAVAQLLLEGMAIDKISGIKGMPTPTQIAYMRKHDPAFAEAMHTAFEGAGIEVAFVLLAGARDGKIGKNQLEAAKWVAERMAPDLFQERKTITNHESVLTDDELMFQLQAAARSDDKVRKLLMEIGGVIDVEIEGNAPGEGAIGNLVTTRRPAAPTRKAMRQLKRFMRPIT